MSTTFEFGTIKQIGAVVIAVVIVLAAGTVVGQAPMIFGAEVTDDPEASIEFSDQSGDGTSVTIDSVSVSDGGFVVVTNGDEIVGVSDYIESEDENVTVEQRGDEDLEMLGQLTATVHQDTTGTETFVSEADAAEDEDIDEHDRPYIDGGYPVSETATVTMDEGPEDNDSSTSFLVESAEAPETVTTNESVEVVTQIRNPNDFEDRQHVDFRLDGKLVERQVLSLEADETRELNVTIDLGGVEPGEHIYGIYTTNDGSLGQLQVEPDDASVTALEAESDRVVADATLTVDGFLAVESEVEAENGTSNDTVVGTSDSLEAGDHENVTIDLDDSLEDGESLSVVLYEGDPDDLENASAYHVDGERIEASAVVGEDVASESENETESDGERAGTGGDEGAGTSTSTSTSSDDGGTEPATTGG